MVFDDDVAGGEKLNSNSKSNGGAKTELLLPRDGLGQIAAHTFTFRELAAATMNFHPDTFLGEGGFGRVYKGRLDSTGQVVAVKQLDRNGLQGNREFLVEVLMLSLLHHPNLVNLIGYCADGDQRLLVYEFMSLGSLEDHLHGKSLSFYHFFYTTEILCALSQISTQRFLLILVKCQPLSLADSSPDCLYIITYKLYM